MRGGYLQEFQLNTWLLCYESFDSFSLQALPTWVYQGNVAELSHFGSFDNQKSFETQNCRQLEAVCVHHYSPHG